METVTLWLCIDCTQYAHGIAESDRGEAYPAAVIDAFSDRASELSTPGNLTPGGIDTHTGECIDPETGDVYPVDDCECDDITFTWNRCDGCLSPMGGARSAFTLWFS